MPYAPAIAPAAAPPLSVCCTPERRAVPGAAGGQVRLLLNVQAMPLPPAFSRPVLNLCLLIDRSGSMDGAPLDAARAACRGVVDVLEAGDFFSVVTFGDEADVVVPARRVSQPALVKDYIARINAGGRANLSAGLAAACGQVASVKSVATLNRVLLLSDGEPSTGARDVAGIVAQAEQQRGRGIGVSTIGLGPDFSEELLAGIAGRTGANFYSCARPQELAAAFAAEVQSLLHTTARFVRLRLHLGRGVGVRQIFNYPAVQGQRMAEIALPDLTGGAGVSTLWEMDATPRPAAPYRVAVAELLYEDALSGRQMKTTADCVLDFADGDALPAPDATVEGELVAARAALFLQDAARKASAGFLAPPAARAEAERVRADLLDAGRLVQARLAAQAVQDMDGGVLSGKALALLAFQLGQGRTSGNA